MSENVSENWKKKKKKSRNIRFVQKENGYNNNHNGSTDGNSSSDGSSKCEH